MTAKIAVLDDYAGVALDVGGFDQIGDAEISVYSDTLTDHDALVSRLAPYDVICMMRERTPFPGSLIKALPNLKLLVTTGPRNLSIDLEAATEHGVIVSSTESRKTTTSELSMLLLLNLSRNFMNEHRSMEGGGWQGGLGRDLHGQSLGLIGLGKIGCQMAALGKAFGMNVHAWSANLSEQTCEENGVQYHRELASLMSASDAVSVHMVLSERSTGIVDAAAFQAMREKAIFINTSRGPIVKEQDLINGLKKGRPWKAALDVYDEEPLPGSSPLHDKELTESGRLLLSPHLGYVTEQTWNIYYTQTVDAILAWIDGKPIRVLNS